MQDILEHFDTGMLTTRDQRDQIQARPMAIADRDANGGIWFITSADTQKIDEMRAHPNVAVSFQGSRRYLSITGRAEVLRDQQRVEQLWSKAFDPWFEQGKDDPQVTLVHVRPVRAEYWDQTGTKGLRFLYEAAKAAFSDDTANADDRDLHGVVELTQLQS